MRIIKNGSGYELIDLDRKLKNRVLCNLRQRNLRLMKDCLEDAFQLADDRRGKPCAEGHFAHVPGGGLAFV